MRLFKDNDIREVLTEHIKKVYPSALIKNEFRISEGFVRSDIGVIGNSLHGYEIKSDFDNFRRLPVQSMSYSNVFTKATLVTTIAQVEKALEYIPEWWEVLVAGEQDGKLDLVTYRRGEENINNCIISTVQLLKEKEAKELLKLTEFEIKPASSHNDNLRMLLNLYSDEELTFLVCLKLKARYKGFINSKRF